MPLARLKELPSTDESRDDELVNATKKLRYQEIREKKTGKTLDIESSVIEGDAVDKSLVLNQWLRLEILWNNVSDTHEAYAQRYLRVDIDRVPPLFCEYAL